MPEKQEKGLAQISAEEAAGQAVEKLLVLLLEAGFKRFLVFLFYASLILFSVLIVMYLNIK